MPSSYYRDWYASNAEARNARRREKYHADGERRRRILEANRATKARLRARYVWLSGVAFRVMLG